MDWATRKRLKYFVLLFLIIFAGVFFAVLPLFNVSSTCSDNKKNGTEVGVDCGGTCQYLCSSQVSIPQIMWTRALPSADGRVALVTYIKNQNKTAGVQHATYKFTLFDNLGKVVAIKEGETQISANGNIAIFAGPVDIGKRKVQNTTFEWTSPLYFSTLSDRALLSNIEIVKTNLEIASTTTALSANLRNTTRLEYESVPVVAILYDKDGNALLASRTILDSLAKETSADIFFTWNTVTSSEVASIEVLPYFEQFAQKNK